ncbi:glycoside hydrolase 5 family protein [Ruania alba]|uniref:Endo-1,4-beta-mannosidase n=1 Tax=Ruania alba TaxID=648782 RepID=A0A1H5KIF3_9MICO|nr:cellulase family glycosylhydrolase [Ruania alba]SEE64563.1 Endo-1,4-beta-mannosidase [Ruania alba]
MNRNAAKLHVNGDPQTWIGVNYWSRAGGPRMWRDYDREIVLEELTSLRDHGMTVTRSFFYWPDFMPTPDTLDEEMLARYQHFLDLHEQLGMSTIPTFLVGHMSGQNWDPAWRGGRDIFGDVWFVARQAWYVRELTARFAEHPAVAAWLLTNEIPIYGDWKSRGIGTLDAEQVRSWAQILIDAVRAGGGHQPVSVGDGAWGVEITGRDNGFRVREMAELSDFLGPHVYRMETDQVRQNLGAAFICELLDIDGRPVVMEEFGLTSDYVSEEHAGHYYRQILHHTLLAGAAGWLAWNNTDYDALENVEPYSHHPFEMHFGLFDSSGRPKPQALEMRDFARSVEHLGLARTSRPDSDIALVVSSFLEAQYPFTQPEDATTVFDVCRQAYVAAREADLAVGVAREADGLPTDCGLYLLPSAKQLTAPTWSTLRALARDGATVYCSYFQGAHPTQRGSWWPNVDQTFGVRRQSRYGIPEPITDDELRLVFLRDFGGIAAGEELTFAVAGNVHSRAFLPVEPDGAEVIAEDAHGRPALLRHRTGTGAMVLSTYPLEYMAAETPFVNPEPTWRLYAALAAESGTRPAVRVDDPRVIVGELDHEDGRRLTWFLSQSEDELTVHPEVDGAELYDSSAPVTELRLPPYGVQILERRPSMSTGTPPVLTSTATP